MSSVALRLSTRSSLFSATDPSFSLPPSSRSSSSGSVSRPGTPTPQAPSPAPSSSPPARCPPPFLSCLPVSFLRAASTVGAAAAASKVLGLMREMVLAAAFGVGPVMTAFRWAEVLPAFGVGPVMTAFSYASLIPTFCLSLLGGVNGPFHSAIASVLSKAAEKDTGKDSEKDTGKDSEKGRGRSSLNAARMQQELLVLVSVLVALASIVAAVLIFLCARPIIDLLAPGLSFPPAAVASDPSAVASFALTRHVAISQLQQMAPTIALAPLIGIGFGTLSARGEFAIPSLSPSLSSLSVLLGIAVYFALCRWSPVASPQREIIGGTCLAVSFTAGARLLLVWNVSGCQLHCRCSPAVADSGALAHFQVLSSPFSEQLREVFGVLIPATVASGMLQIATFTDLYFASFLPGTAAALGYANLLVMAPLGILSTALPVPPLVIVPSSIPTLPCSPNLPPLLLLPFPDANLLVMAPLGILSTALLVPLLPAFARLAHPKDRPLLKDSLRRGLVMALAVTLPMTAVMLPLARPIVRIVFQRRSFDASATSLVSSLLSC
ncbi:unnamed protein product, partial [Closterium sp. NIES-65]